LMEATRKRKHISAPSWGHAADVVITGTVQKRPQTQQLDEYRKRTLAGAVDRVEPRRAAETTSSVGTTAGQRTARGGRRCDSKETKRGAGDPQLHYLHFLAFNCSIYFEVTLPGNLNTQCKLSSGPIRRMTDMKKKLPQIHAQVTVKIKKKPNFAKN